MTDYKIWFLVDPTDCPPDFDHTPIGLDYKTSLKQRLHPVIDIVKGEVQSVDYYCHFNKDTKEYSDLILRVEFEWVRDENKILVERRDLRRWTTVDSDNDSNPIFGPDQKRGIKFYTPQMADHADHRRRNNIVDALKSQALLFGAVEQNQKMFDSLANQLFSYEQSGSATLIQSIMTYPDETEPGLEWLDVLINTKPGYELYPSTLEDGSTPLTVRMAILEQLSL